MNTRASVKTILFLTANPQTSVPLRLDTEMRDIKTGLKQAGMRDRFQVEFQPAVRAGDIQQAILEFKPQIIHFSGHGQGNGVAVSGQRDIGVDPAEAEASNTFAGLVLENEAGGVQVTNGEAIANLFRVCRDDPEIQIECLVMNACHSADMAEAISEYVPYVIGMDGAIGDDAARTFAVGFYSALGENRAVPLAYQYGCNAMEMSGIGEAHKPKIYSAIGKYKKQNGTLSSGNHSKQHLESPDGQVRIDSRFYIHSPCEERCFSELVKPGSLIRIKSPHNMGKSSLMARVLEQATELGYRTVVIDFAQTNQKFFDDLDRFMQWFCASVGKKMGIRVKLEDYWDDIFGANDNSTDFFERYVLNEEDPPLVLALDNFDRIFDYSDIETDLCGLLRGWHETSKTKSLWEQLRLIIVHSQESYAKRDINQSPFNVGLPIELGEFTKDQVQNLVDRHGLKWSDAELSRLMAMIGGHPHMVRLALYALANGDCSLEELLAKAPTEEGIFSNHLRKQLKTLEECPDLKLAMKMLVESEEPVSLKSSEAFKLDSMGLVVRVDNQVKPRCTLYRLYFQERLGG